jgi:hypothetical protein
MRIGRAVTAPVANPSLRWFLAYAAAALGGTLAATLGSAAVTGTIPSPALWLTRILPFAAVGLFVPVAVVSFLLLKANLWTLPGFALAGAAIPALFLILVALANAPGQHFAASLIVWTLSGALAGALFHQVWESLS